MSMKERVEVTDAIGFNLQAMPEAKRDDSPTIEGYLKLVMRERGKLVPNSLREGKNIWTLTGREYLAMLMSYKLYVNDPHGSGLGAEDQVWRDDRIRYIGLGSGTTPEVAGVSQLVSPLPYESGQFLAQVSIPSFPLSNPGSGARTTARYTRSYSEDQLSLSGSVIITEAGLFTDGSPDADFAPQTRDLSIVNATQQAPMGYKSFEPIRKTKNFVMELFWEVRF